MDRGALTLGSGHPDGLKFGSELGSQVGYRLPGIHPSKDLAQARAEAQIHHRLGDQGIDSRAVCFLGSGPTVEHLAHRPGEWVTAADGRIILDAMFALDP